ncbi:MAG: polysaccharide deacetylase family protein [Proteobacteria bacterium]|nr:polysaccharide deacetylase family protein [Pseudomonadota bacterium]
MRRGAAAALLLATLFCAVPPCRGDAPPHARVLLYHRVGDTRYPSTNVSTEAFREQMGWLRDHGFHVVPTEVLEGFLRQGQPLPAGAVAIHFDDGYRSVFDNALPVLREFGYPFTVFVATEAVERGYQDFVTWDQARELALAGASFGAHGHRHLRLGAPEAGEPAARYAERIRAEFLEGARRLRDRDFAIRWLAYPYGEYNSEVQRQAREAGFDLAFSQDPGAIGRAQDPYCLPRFAVVGASADMTVFAERMSYLPLDLLGETPPPGPLAVEAPGFVSAIVPAPEEYDLRQGNVFLSEQGRLESRFDPRTGQVTAEVKGPLRRRLNRVLVSLRHKATGKFALGAWLLVNPGGSP